MSCSLLPYYVDSYTFITKIQQYEKNRNKNKDKTKTKTKIKTQNNIKNMEAFTRIQFLVTME
jgi:hypothetical protein